MLLRVGVGVGVSGVQKQDTTYPNIRHTRFYQRYPRSEGMCILKNKTLLRLNRNSYYINK